MIYIEYHVISDSCRRSLAAGTPDKYERDSRYADDTLAKFKLHEKGH